MELAVWDYDRLGPSELLGSVVIGWNEKSNETTLSRVSAATHWQQGERWLGLAWKDFLGFGLGMGSDWYAKPSTATPRVNILRFGHKNKLNWYLYHNENDRKPVWTRVFCLSMSQIGVKNKQWYLVCVWIVSIFVWLMPRYPLYIKLSYQTRYNYINLCS